jgi:hypothetical protein
MNTTAVGATCAPNDGTLGSITQVTPLAPLTAPVTVSPGSAGNCTALVLPAIGPTASTFDSGPITVTVTNTGTTTATISDLPLTNPVASPTAADVALAQQTYLCTVFPHQNPNPNNPQVGWAVLSNTSVDSYVSNPGGRSSGDAGNVLIKLSPGGTFTFEMDFFAGQPTNFCADHGQFAGGAMVLTPGPDTQGVLTGLDNTAEGGTINPTISFNATA